jgi:1-acyl-sn-glycerol-3-phosphate acyltransferase
VLIAPTHRSNLDFAFSLMMSERKIFFMAKDSLFRVPGLGRAIAALGAFPVARGTADREALRAAESVLRAGEALLLFPEGTRKYGPTVDDLRDGAMFIAARSGATVVPVAIGGTEGAWGRKGHRHWPKVHIVIAEPLTIDSGDGRASRSLLTGKTEELRQALESAYARSTKR